MKTRVNTNDINLLDNEDFHLRFYKELNIKPQHTYLCDDRYMVYYLIVLDLKTNNQLDVVRFIRSELKIGMDIEILMLSLVRDIDNGLNVYLETLEFYRKKDIAKLCFNKKL